MNTGLGLMESLSASIGLTGRPVMPRMLVFAPGICTVDSRATSHAAATAPLPLRKSVR